MTKRFTNLQFLLTLLCFSFFSTTLKAQIEDFKVGTTNRKMLVYAPSSIVPNRPLLISMHGLNQDIAYQQNQTKWELVAKENNFVVVYPGGINNSWDISGTKDTEFILAIIDEMAKRYNIDRDRVYLSGFSMGGMMTYHAATKIADKIAAFAPVSGYLMGGPNTNSSRPIPIIHTHGTADDVVPFSGVSTCLNAWVKRNNCPATAVVTKPYPMGKTTGDSKSYWGTGTDSVEIVLLSLNGKGHWHSNEPNGVHTSQEIWNFCKKYSLSYGVPKFVSASVTNENPKQVQVTLSLPIKESDNFNGFSVKIDGQIVSIDSVVLATPNKLLINLTDRALNSNEISVSYTNGNVVSTYEKKLVGFENKLVENLLAGASPRIVELATTENGDTIKMQFNKKMQLPSDISTLMLKSEFNGDSVISILQSSYFNNDSTVLAFPLGNKVFADYKLQLTYSGNNFVAADSSAVKTFSNLQVVNKSIGLPVKIVSGTLESDAVSIGLKFSKPMAMGDAQISQFTFDVNGKTVSAKEIFVQNDAVRFSLTNNLYYGDSIKVTYTPGNVTSADKGPLEAFSSFTVSNPLQEPTWYAVPGKVEAENYALQFGTDKEQTGDTGGGLNVGWIENNDWLVYAIDNTTDDANYVISFRLAAQSAGGSFSYSIDNVKAGLITVPNTGGWQIWQSVVKKIKMTKGKHYLKIFANTGGFNVNYIEIKKDLTGIEDFETSNITVYPNPASDFISIKSPDFQYNKIEIIDVLGKTVLSKSVSYEPQLNLPIGLANGTYMVKVSDGKINRQKFINIENK